jgi:hypothetical protein
MRLLPLLASVCTICCCPAAFADLTAPLPKWGPFVDLVGEPGSSRSIGEVDLFAPISQTDRSLTFADIRTRADTLGSDEGNFGLGERVMSASGWNFGAYAYFDRLSTPFGTLFNQATFGGEALSRNWDFRSNGYLPLGPQRRMTAGLNAASVVGTSVILRQGEEVALSGLDSEVGWRIPITDEEGPLDIRFYAGGYRFTGPDVAPVQGPRLRLEFTLAEIPELWPGSRLTIGGEVQHDRPRGTQDYALVRLRIPLDVFGETESIERLTAMENRMTDPIVRDVDIVSRVGAFGPPEPVTMTANGIPINVVSSKTTSAADMPGLVNSYGSNSFVILSGSWTLPGTGLSMQPGQTVMGRGTIEVRSNTGQMAMLTTPGVSIVDSSPFIVVQMANNSTIEGLNILGTITNNNLTGVQAAGANGVKLIDNNITMINTAGAFGPVAADIAGTNETISGNHFTGISPQGSATALAFAGTGVISGNVLRAAGGNGFASDAISISSGAPTILSPRSTGNSILQGGCVASTTGIVGNVGFSGSTCP